MTDPNEPTGWMPPPTGAGGLGGQEPTQYFPGAAGPGGPMGPGGPVEPGGPVGPAGPFGEDPSRTLMWVVIGLVVVLAILLGILLATRKTHHSSGASTTTTSTTSTTSSTSTSTSTSTTTSTEAPTTTSTQAPTTTTSSTTAAAAGGNRAPTAGEQAALLAAGETDYPSYQVSLIRIANSDSSWAALEYQPRSSADQAFSEVRHLVGSTWQSVDKGTAQVDCTPDVPAQVQADFANVLGSCS